MRPSSETVFSLKGSPTLSRPALSSVGLNSSDSRRVIASWIAASRSGVSSLSPSGAAKTRLSTPPCSEANSASIRSVALCVSEPGISNSSRSSPPTVPTRRINAAMMPIQAPMTRQGCVAHARVQRASPPFESRSWAERRSVIGLRTSGAVSEFRPSSGLLFGRLNFTKPIVIHHLRLLPQVRYNYRSERPHLWVVLRDRLRPRARRGALGSFGRPRPDPRPEALHRPAAWPPANPEQRPVGAPQGARGDRHRPPPAAAAAPDGGRLRAYRVRAGARGRCAPARPLGSANARGTAARGH